MAIRTNDWRKTETESWKNGRFFKQFVVRTCFQCSARWWVTWLAGIFRLVSKVQRGWVPIDSDWLRVDSISVAQDISSSQTCPICMTLLSFAFLLTIDENLQRSLSPSSLCRRPSIAILSTFANTHNILQIYSNERETVFSWHSSLDNDCVCVCRT